MRNREKQNLAKKRRKFSHFLQANKIQKMRKFLQKKLNFCETIFLFSRKTQELTLIVNLIRLFASELTLNVNLLSLYTSELTLNVNLLSSFTSKLTLKC